MNIREAYNHWSAQYDTNMNPTRDLEGVALREMLADLSFKQVLEIGCGTGKNTAWLLTCLLYTSPSPRDLSTSRMPSSA